MRLAEVRLGDWRPGTTHPTLVAIQLVALWQAGLRGLDYAGGIGTGLDAGAASPAYGWLLFASTTVVLVGLGLRRAPLAILGHGLLASWYAGLGVETLVDLGAFPGWPGYGGLVLGLVGVWLLLSERVTPALRLVGVVAMLGGQFALVDDLAGDYRAGTGLVAQGLLHATLAVATFVLWQRQRLGRVVDDEQP